MVVLLALLVALVLHMKSIESTSRNSNPGPSWLPPERFHKKIFNYEPIYSAENAEEAQKAWTNLIPMGKGFVVITNDTVLPDMPQLNQSLPEQHAMVSVFHQLHCLFIAREAYFNPGEVNLKHLYHCWDYLRQGIMCSSDTSLEWMPAPPNDMGSTGWGYEHVCRDYGEVFDWAERNKLTDHKKIH
ncbi:hypothetical protein OCU04_008287 [Sclerotinia nivalis]|uniref:Oxidase ustYa n=1 Tax=Sclerotinia nivalis TaxID=352851 RepID=A0A9X0ALD6_9HELO|nr:hypothetical protein OCU04_008287 [Sclerotinia nivalis]